MLKFTTKRDINGNRYTLIVDFVNKMFSRSYNTSYDYSDYITINKQDRRKMIDQLLQQGFKEV